MFRTEPVNQVVNHQPSITIRETKQPPADVADVLLSLKHAVVHPGQQIAADKYDAQQHLYHPQVLLSPNAYAPALCDQQCPQQAPMFPSMSVNVSMNMTMHGYHPSQNYSTTEMTYPQVINSRRVVAWCLTWSSCGRCSGTPPRKSLHP